MDNLFWQGLSGIRLGTVFGKPVLPVDIWEEVELLAGKEAEKREERWLRLLRGVYY